MVRPQSRHRPSWPRVEYNRGTFQSRSGRREAIVDDSNIDEWPILVRREIWYTRTVVSGSSKATTIWNRRYLHCRPSRYPKDPLSLPHFWSNLSNHECGEMVARKYLGGSLVLQSIPIHPQTTMNHHHHRSIPHHACFRSRFRVLRG